MNEELADTAEAMEAKATAHDVPAGWKVLFVGLVVWGAWYLYAYSPWGTGWTQAGELEAKVVPSIFDNVGMTILFTALPTLAAVTLFMMQRRKRS
jgi:hypothetical protein